ncbi:MAG TPA: putative beta-lysine N-acetyltransferase [Treponema sp.]|nr:putative beta-lysine N-acetyltransferase [Treponema sp.]
MNYDTIETKDGALFQHGKENDRIYLMGWDGLEPERLLKMINRYIEENKYTKAFIKIPENHTPFFAENGFTEEARIPSYYDEKDCVFMSWFVDPQRAIIPDAIHKTIKKNRALAQKYGLKKEKVRAKLSGKYSLRKLTTKDSTALTALYRIVFKTYPFPIQTPEYVEKTMGENVQYFGIFSGETLVAASAVEIDHASNSVELTDFATTPNHRGNSFASILLQEMERSMKEQGIRTRYTIARALSAGMNITFAKAGYRYAGTLVNNTDIAGTIESMNVWYAEKP